MNPLLSHPLDEYRQRRSSTPASTAVAESKGGGADLFLSCNLAFVQQKRLVRHNRILHHRMRGKNKRLMMPPAVPFVRR